MTRFVAAAAVAVLVLGAGCAAVAPFGPETTRDPLSAPTLTPDPSGVAPGLSERGVTDAGRLTSTHSTVLTGVGFRLRTTEVERYANGTLRTRSTMTGTFGGYGRTYRSTLTFRGRVPRIANQTAGNVTLWSNGERIYRAFRFDGRTRYAVDVVDSPYERYGFRPTHENRLYVLLTGTDIGVTAAGTTGNHTLYRLAATGITDRPLLDGTLEGDGVRDLSFVAFVDERGLVHAYRLRYTAQKDGATVNIRRTARFTPVESLDIERPDWYDEAANATDPE